MVAQGRDQSPAGSKAGKKGKGKVVADCFHFLDSSLWGAIRRTAS